MGDMETTVDDVTTDVDTGLDTTDDSVDDTVDDTDERVALFNKYKINPKTADTDDLYNVLKRLKKAEETKRVEKSKKKESSVAQPTDSIEDIKLDLFFLKNEEARPYQEEFKKVREQYPALSFDDTLELAKSRTPKESKTEKAGFKGGTFKSKPKSLEEMNDEEALDLSPEDYHKWMKKTGKIM